MNIITGNSADKDTCVSTCSFYVDEIMELIDNPSLSEGQLQEIADLLTANLELFGDDVPKEGEPLTIDRNKFNDSFWDMVADLQEMFGNKWRDEND